MELCLRRPRRSQFLSAEGNSREHWLYIQSTFWTYTTSHWHLFFPHRSPVPLVVFLRKGNTCYFFSPCLQQQKEVKRERKRDKYKARFPYFSPLTYLHLTMMMWPFHHLLAYICHTYIVSIHMFMLTISQVFSHTTHMNSTFSALRVYFL